VPIPIQARILQLEDERDVSNGELIRLLADHNERRSRTGGAGAGSNR
jgi:hypothetical protein